MLSAVLAVALSAASSTPDAYGGTLLESGSVSIWHKEAGPKGAPAVMYLHGGPGYGSFTFERAVGKRLEHRLRMIYVDQRGAGRATVSDDPMKYGLDAMVEDIEHLRESLALPKVGFIAHAFGALVAVAYYKKYPEHVTGMLLVEATPDLRAAFTSQIEYLAKVAPSVFKDKAADVQQVVASADPASLRLLRLYQLLGPRAVQRQIDWPSSDAQDRMLSWEQQSGLPDHPPPALLARLREDGVLDTRQSDLAIPIRVQGALFYGRRSHALGSEAIKDATDSWRLPALWFERSGHYPFVDEPDLFASRALAILGH